MLPAWADTYWRAWGALRHDRHYGAIGGAARIYFAAIEGYAARYGIEGVEFERFLFIIMQMDAEYLDYLNERLKANEGKGDKHGDCA